MKKEKMFEILGKIDDKSVNEAYETLSDNKKRKNYDKTIYEKKRQNFISEWRKANTKNRILR